MMQCDARSCVENHGFLDFGEIFRGAERASNSIEFTQKVNYTLI